MIENVATPKTQRDEFSPSIKKTLADRVNHLCSNPDCRASTHGPVKDANKSSHLGFVAHIHAAAPGGARYLASQSPEERSHIDNAIYLCANCAKKIDDDAATFTPDLLKSWKMVAEYLAGCELGKPQSRLSQTVAEAPRAELVLGYEKERTLNPTVPTVRYYKFYAILQNVGKVRIDDWSIEVEFPSAFMGHGINQAYTDERRSTSQVRCFERRPHPSDNFLSKRSMQLPVLYAVNSKFHAEHPEMLSLPVVVRAYVDGLELAEKTLPMQDIIDVGDLPAGVQ